MSSAEDVELDSDLIESKQRVSVHSRYYCTLKQERLKDGSVKQSYFYVYVTTGTLKRLHISLVLHLITTVQLHTVYTLHDTLWGMYISTAQFDLILGQIASHSNTHDIAQR